MAGGHMEFVPPFGEWMRCRRKAMDLTQGELAVRAGYALVTVRKVEAGVLRPSRELATRLADALGVEPADRAAFVAFARGLPLEHQRHTFPEPAATLLGREREVAAALSLLAQSDVRLITFCGPPGVGKTRLAERVAALAAAQFEDGVCAIWLRSAYDPGQVLSSLAQALQLQRASGAASLLQTVKGYLRGSNLLLLFDNFEHVAEAALVLDDLLEASPGVKIIVTSRQPLHLAAEHLFDVQPLPTPAAGEPVSAAQALAYPAVALYAERAQAASARFTLTDANAGDVAEICRRLDGLPLALELAAAHARHYTARTLLSKLPTPLAGDPEERDGLDMLTRGPRDAPAWHATMRATIDWSYRLLGHAERYWFRRLGVFVDGCDAEQLAHLEPGVTVETVTEVVLDLADRGLVRILDEDDGLRCTMLFLVQQFALEQLVACGELEQVREAHARAFLALAQRAWPEWAGPQQRHWSERFRRETGNLDAALEWCASDCGDARLGLELAGHLLYFWQGFEPQAGLKHIERLMLRAPADVPESVRARALLVARSLAGADQANRGLAEA